MKNSASNRFQTDRSTSGRLLMIYPPKSDFPAYLFADCLQKIVNLLFALFFGIPCNSNGWRFQTVFINRAEQIDCLAPHAVSSSTKSRYMKLHILPVETRVIVNAQLKTGMDCMGRKRGKLELFNVLFVKDQSFNTELDFERRLRALFAIIFMLVVLSIS